MKKKLLVFNKFFKNNISKVAIVASVVLFLIVSIPIIDKIYSFAKMGDNIHSLIDSRFSPEEEKPASPGGVVDMFDSSTKKTQTSEETNKQNTTTQPTVQTNQSTNTQANGGCEKTNIIPYSTTYENVGYLYPEQGYSSGGVDGYTFVCIVKGKVYSSNVFPPYNKTVYVGTKVRTTTTTTPYTPPPTPDVHEGVGGLCGDVLGGGYTYPCGSQ
jgi:hypothetical protein